MPRPPFNALQAILIRERLILYLEHRRQEKPSFSIHKLIEVIIFSEANDDKPDAYREEIDEEGRYDRAMALKNNSIGNFVTRKSSALDAENLPLIRDFLVHEGFLSPNLLRTGAKHPEPWISQEFRGLATADPRLQSHRAALEGEYLRSEGNGTVNQLWIAAPGRSKPFVTLRAITRCPANESPPSIRCLNLDAGLPKVPAEGRIFLMPGRTLVLVEVSETDKSWSGRIEQVRPNSDILTLQQADGSEDHYERISVELCATSPRSQYQIDKARRASRISQPNDGETRFPRIGAMSPVRDRRRILAASIRRRPNQDALDADLLAAAAQGDARGVFHALSRGANINSQKTGTGRTAAHLAAAVNSREAVLVLAGDDDSEGTIIKKYAQALSIDDAALDVWRGAKMQRDPLAVDSEEGCYPSAFAPVGFDNTSRNARATANWRTLMRSEMSERSSQDFRGRYAHLEFWKPSTVMAATLASGDEHP